MADESATFEVLASLAERVDVHNRDFSSTVGVVNDVGRAVASSAEPHLRQLQAAIASVRERLQSADGLPVRPCDALKNDKSEAFAAGALWALDDVISAALVERRHRHAGAGSTTVRGAMRGIVLELAKEQDTVTPSQIANAARERGQAVSLDQVSKALSDLVRQKCIVAVASPTDNDRRSRHFALCEVDSLD